MDGARTPRRARSRPRAGAARRRQPQPGAVPNGQPCSLPDAGARLHRARQQRQARPARPTSAARSCCVNFWASWCGVCKTEKPQLSAMADEMASDDFVVIALASDQQLDRRRSSRSSTRSRRAPRCPRGKTSRSPTRSTAYKQALPNGVPFQVLLDPPTGDDNIGADRARRGASRRCPSRALIDRKGNIRAYFVNKRDWQSPVARDLPALGDRRRLREHGARPGDRRRAGCRPADRQGALGPRPHRRRSRATARARSQRVKHEPPDVILLDSDLPKIDGAEVCRRLKTDRRRPRTSRS